MDFRNLNRPQFKTDQVFHDAFRSLGRKANLSLFLQLLKIVPLAILVFIYLNDNSAPDNLNLNLLINIIVSSIGLLLQLLLIFRIFSNVDVFLNLAQATNHIVENEHIINSSKIDNCVSESIYVKENDIKREDFDDKGREIMVKLTQNIINTVLRSQKTWILKMDNLYSLMSLASMIFTIFTLVQGGLDTSVVVILSVYVVLVGLSNLPVIILLLLIALIPLLCIFFCLFMCCCGAKGAGQYISVPSTQATMTEVVNSGGDCPICRQSIDTDSKVYVLPCSQKHVFHSVCLNQWAKIKNTCPTCRGLIPMNSTARNSQIMQQQ